MKILAGDIGGTNTRLSIWERDDADARGVPRQIGEISKFKNAGFASFDAILDKYLADTPNVRQGGGVTDACFGVAGPVKARTVSLTNIPHWPAMDADAIAAKLDIANARRVTLINDMPAHGASLASIESIAPNHITTLHAGVPQAEGMRAIVMPGTGLGVGMLVWERQAKLHRPLPTEAGHEDLPARDAASAALIESLRKLHPDNTITREFALSGPGLRSIYACLKNPAAPDCATAPKPEEIQAAQATDDVARRTFDLFARLLGELCGNVALGCLATGGVYLAGSIANSLSDRLKSPLFVEAFASTGPKRMRPIIESIPVKLVRYEETGLLGTATYASWVADERV